MTAMIERAVTVLTDLISLGHPLCLTLSGGKDSTTTTILGLEAIRRVTAQGLRQARHTVSSADTTIENPAMSAHLHAMLEEIDDFCAEAGLPVDVQIAKPTLSSQFVVSTIGRGTLVRTPENGVLNGVRKRPCSDDWKVQPQGRLARRLMTAAAAEGWRDPVAVLGSRRDESASRAGSMQRNDQQPDLPTRGDAGQLTISPIANWSTDDVWSFLGRFNNAGSAPFPTFTRGRSIDRMLALYRDGNEGVCGVVQGESGNRAACGSRFGCAFCCVSGDRDRSMESMIREPRHAHLAGLNRYRNFLLHTQWDLSRRELVGRTLSPAGYLKIQPDVYSLDHRRQLLRMLLTLDVLEQERADRHEADLATGRLADTMDNRELAQAQFQFVTPQQLVAIDFHWSLHHFAPHAFPALREWHEIYGLGRRYPVPDLAPLSKPTMSAPGWFPTGQFDAAVPTDGLRSYSDEQWNRYRHPERPGSSSITSDGDPIVRHEEDDEFTVDAERACELVTCVYGTAMMLDTQSVPAIESARFWLNEGIVRLARGTAWKYQLMARRGQYFARLSERLGLTPDALNRHLQRHCISDAAHAALIAEADTALDSRQPALFAG